MRHLSASEAHRHLGLVSFFQKLGQVSKLDSVVPDIGSRTKFDLFDRRLFLFFLRLLTFLALVENLLAVIQDSAYRRLRVRRNLDQVEACIIGLLLRLSKRNDTRLLTLLINQSYRVRSYLIIDPNLLLFSDV